MIGDDIIGGLGSENEEAVAADGILVDALATAFGLLISRAVRGEIAYADHNTFIFSHAKTKSRSGCSRTFLPQNQANTPLPGRPPGTQANFNRG